MTVGQGGEQPAFRVNVWDIVAVLSGTATALFGSIAGMFAAFSHLARGHSGFIDDLKDFQEYTSHSIEMIAGDDNGI